MLAGLAMAMNSVTVVGKLNIAWKVCNCHIKRKEIYSNKNLKRIIPCSQLLDNGIYSNKNNIAE
jgi:hypothetical protein